MCITQFCHWLSANARHDLHNVRVNGQLTSPHALDCRLIWRWVVWTRKDARKELIVTKSSALFRPIPVQESRTAEFIHDMKFAKRKKWKLKKKRFSVYSIWNAGEIRSRGRDGVSQAPSLDWFTRDRVTKKRTVRRHDVTYKMKFFPAMKKIVITSTKLQHASTVVDKITYRPFLTITRRRQKPGPTGVQVVVSRGRTHMPRRLTMHSKTYTTEPVTRELLSAWRMLWADEKMCVSVRYISSVNGKMQSLLIRAVLRYVVNVKHLST